ncbi:Opaque-phase-specific protein OP4 [Candida viswanathii]|uniref:Opaque-phase-specific protein OP4 n=1 Tax=Candida viswanathii TaxID=5486 RepID=A0A367YE40_9ASCO|nr:Opaque-phase-specific protein OP4 [Candida viswanathii]
MKFSSATVLAILASSACVSAAPTFSVPEQTLVKRTDINEVLNLIEEIKALNFKRDYVEGKDLLELERRADNAFSELISALANSGIIGLIWDKLTTDPSISEALKNIVKAALQTAVVQGSALIQAVWNSGLLGDIFDKLINDTDLRQAFLDVVKSIFGTAANLISSWISGGSSSSSTAAASGAAKRQILAAAPTAGASKREVMDAAEYLSERDLYDIISWIVTEIKDSGIVQSLVQKVISDPQAVVSFLTSAFKTGLVVAEEVYSWAKESGLWDSALNYIKENAGTWAGTIASFIGQLLSNGSLSASDIDNAGSSSATTTAAAGSTLSTRAVSSSAPAAAALGTSSAAGAAAAAPVSAATSATGSTAAATGATASTGANGDALESLIAKYGGTPESTTPTVDTSGLTNDVNTLVSAAGQAASSLKVRRLY